MVPRSLSFLLGLLISSCAFDRLPMPFTSPPMVAPNTNLTCETPPPILSYHVHVVFDGANASVVKEAKKLRSLFDLAMGHEILRSTICPFSHANPMPKVDYICPFAWDDSGPLQPWTGIGLFGGENYAYFIPETHYVKAMNWWRQHHGNVHYMMHVNTGCEDKSHTTWAMTDNAYSFVEQKTTGLWCCHEGPPGCYCDIVQYEFENTSLCLSVAKEVQGSNLVLSNCSEGLWGLATWRETHYTSSLAVEDNLVQIENFGTGESNSYLCAGVKKDACREGEPVSLQWCGASHGVKIDWVATKATEILSDFRKQPGSIVVRDCPGLCVGVEKDGEGLDSLVLEVCEDKKLAQQHMITTQNTQAQIRNAVSTWSRKFVD